MIPVLIPLAAVGGIIGAIVLSAECQVLSKHRKPRRKRARAEGGKEIDTGKRCEEATLFDVESAGWENEALSGLSPEQFFVLPA